MQTSSLVVEKARQLAAAGNHAEVVAYLGAQAERDLEGSPTLALLYGAALGRLGRNEEGVQWLDKALDEARKGDDQAVERHALNARGALAFVSGRIDEAVDYCTQALMAASRDGDLATTGRCSNNLGIISNLRGRHAEAIGSWEIALAAFERAGLDQGVAECHNNLAITYLEQGALDRALTEAGKAVTRAEAAGDRTLQALALRGRGEIHVVRGELDLAHHDLDAVRELRGFVPNSINDAEDLRVVALVRAAEGDVGAAERALREVIQRAGMHSRPQLQAEATRDLAIVLHRAERHVEAQAAARAAKAIFAQLGAEREIRKLAGQEWGDDFSAELRGSLEPLHAAQELADAGRYAELVTYLGGRSLTELEDSPMLALLSSIGHSRLGRLDLGQQWALVALSRSRVLGDRRLELRALNVCGAVALERGGITEAAHFFTRAQEEAMQDNDMASVGRCANNLGIVANLQGDYGRAVGAYTRALAAYETAHQDRGIAESQHNLAITYREQGDLDRAMQAADSAVKEAGRLGDERLMAQALAGRAEIRVLRGEPGLAILEAERALAVHRELQDEVRETEDLRILAVAAGCAGRNNDAERMLRDVIDRATAHGRPVLVAAAQRDLAYLWARQGEVSAAKEMARTARAAFHRLGSKVEIDKMTALLTQPNFGTPKGGRAQLADAPSGLEQGGPPTGDASTPKNETTGPA